MGVGYAVEALEAVVPPAQEADEQYVQTLPAVSPFLFFGCFGETSWVLGPASCFDNRYPQTGARLHHVRGFPPGRPPHVWPLLLLPPVSCPPPRTASRRVPFMPPPHLR